MKTPQSDGKSWAFWRANEERTRVACICNTPSKTVQGRALPTCLPHKAWHRPMLAFLPQIVPSTHIPLGVPPCRLWEPQKRMLEEHSRAGGCCGNKSSSCLQKHGEFLPFRQTSLSPFMMDQRSKIAAPPLPRLPWNVMLWNCCQV